MKVPPLDRYTLANETAFRVIVDTGLADARRRLIALERGSRFLDIGTTSAPDLDASKATLYRVASPTALTVLRPLNGQAGDQVQVVIQNTGGAPWVLSRGPGVRAPAGWTDPTVGASEWVQVILTYLGSPDEWLIR